MIWTVSDHSFVNAPFLVWKFIGSAKDVHLRISSTLLSEEKHSLNQSSSKPGEETAFLPPPMEAA